MDKDTFGREVVQLLGIRQPRCGLVFGEGACEATGTPCYKTWATCKFKSAYDKSASIEWMFSRDGDPAPFTYAESGGDIRTNPIPLLRSVSTVASSINSSGQSDIESSLGIAGNIRFILGDIPWDDVFGDDNIADRSPVVVAPFWAKWQARIGEAVTQCTATLYTGYRGDDLGDMQPRKYDLRSMNGPQNGTITGIADAPTRKLNRKLALFPRSTDIAIAQDISETETDIRVLAALVDLSDDFGNTAPRKYLRIGSEVIEYAGFTEIDAPLYALTGVRRGMFATVAKTAKANDAAQRFGWIERMTGYEAARWLIRNHTVLDVSVIDDAQWDQEGGTFLSTIILSGGVPEPTPVAQLVGELARDGLFKTYWNDRLQTMPLRAVRPSIGVPVFLSDQYSIVADSASLETDTEQRITRVITSYDKINPVEGQDNFTNYRRTQARIFTEGESPNFADESVREERIFSRWIRSDSNALFLNNGILLQRQFSPQYMTIDLDAKDIDISTTDEVDLQSKDIINADGSPRVLRWEVLTWNEITPGHKLRLKLGLSQFQAGKRYGIIMANDAPVYADATEAQRANGCWLADDTTGLMPNGDPAYLLW
jgi:hypothetical protein